MGKRTLSGLDRDIFQPLGRILQEAFSDGQVANFAFSSGNAVQWNFTDTAISGTTRGLWINYASATDKSSGENRAFAISMAVTGNCTGAYGIRLYTGGCGTAVIGTLASIYGYMDSCGAGATVSEKHFLDMNIANNAGATLCSFMRMYNHGGTIDAAFYFANNGNAVVANLLKFNASGGCLEPDASSVSGNRTHKIKCMVGGSSFYLNGYAA